MNLHTSFETVRGSRYLQTLCKHFGRKIPVRFDVEDGIVELPFGRCELKASSARLELTVYADTLVDLNQAKQIITSHLERYAFRENPDLQWHPSESHALQA